MLNPDKGLFLGQRQLHEGARRNAPGRYAPYRNSRDARTIGCGHNFENSSVPGLERFSSLNEEQARPLPETDLPLLKRLYPVCCGLLLITAFILGLPELLYGTKTETLPADRAYQGEAASRRDLRQAEEAEGRAMGLAKQIRNGLRPDGIDAA